MNVGSQSTRLVSVVLPAEEQIRLTLEWQKTQDPKILDVLIRSFLDLITRLAARRLRRAHTLNRSDLIQYGIIGLITGLEKYDPAKECVVSTYVTWWIRQGINRYADKYDSVIHVPTHIIEARNKLLKLENDIYYLYGRKPTWEEMKQCTGLSDTQLLVAIEGVEEIVYSLDQPITEGEDTLFLETVVDSNFCLDEEMHMLTLRQKVQRALSYVERPLDREYIVRYFGLDGAPPENFAQIAKRKSRTRESVRQRVRRTLTLMKPFFYGLDETYM